MKTKLFYVIGLILALPLFGCSDNEPKGDNEENEECVSGVFEGKLDATSKTLDLTTEEKSVLANGLNTMQWNIYTRLCAEVKKENIGFSPISLSTALSLLANAAEDEAANEVAKSLGFANLEELNQFYGKAVRYLADAERQSTVELANSVWSDLQKPIFRTYVETVNQKFGATVGSLNFTDQDFTLQTINQWGKKATKGMIPEILDSAPGKDDLVFANALYFKGEWQEPFDEKLTKKADFAGVDQISSVDMMVGEFNSSILESDNYQGVKLGFKDEEMSIYFIISKQADTNANLTEEEFKNLTSVKNDQTILYLPKFKISTSKDLRDICKNCGINLLNVYLTKAVLGFEIIDDPQIIHKTAFEVTETGAKGAASTVIVAPGSTGPGDEIKTIRFDRPFHYVVRDRSGLILLMGKVNQL